MTRPKIPANALARQYLRRMSAPRVSPRTLRVSVMTLHRWRKALAEPQPASAATHQGRQPHLTDNDVERIAELQVENSRLRRLVTDLLLEKMTLDEAASSHEASLEGSNSALRK